VLDAGRVERLVERGDLLGRNPRIVAAHHRQDGRAAAEARGLVRVRNPEGRRWVQAADAPALLEDGWRLA